MTKILIGIDTGVNTGYAVAMDHGTGGELHQVECLSITKAMQAVQEIKAIHGKDNLKLYIEDARKRTWFAGGKEKAQGVGSVKRDAQIWEDWCIEQEFNYIMVHPKANATKTKADLFKKITGWTGRTNEHARDNATKTKADLFKKITGWTGRTNEHARDAAMLVFKRFWKV